MKNIFISYSDTDKKRMRQLENVIAKNSDFKAEIIGDKRSVLTDLTKKVKSGIFESDYIVPILTRHSMNTQWVNQEIGYAVAQNKIIKPIVEKSVIEKLKGFIHKNVDLPYHFEEVKGSPSKTAIKFRKACELLMDDLNVENGLRLKTYNLESLFPGFWRNQFNAPHVNGDEFPIEIKNLNEYYWRGRHWFDLKGFKISSDKQKFSFVKYGRGTDTRIMKNELQILKLREIYEGTEIELSENKPIKVVYSKVPM
jgi:hypothetical protein